MATYSSNTTIKISAAIATTDTSTTTETVTIYTAPANSYAILNIHLQCTTNNAAVFPSAYAVVATRRVLSLTTVGSPKKAVSSSGYTGPDIVANDIYTASVSGIMVGPGQTVALNNTISGSGQSTTMHISGVSFINSP